MRSIVRRFFQKANPSPTLKFWTVYASTFDIQTFYAFFEAAISLNLPPLLLDFGHFMLPSSELFMLQLTSAGG